MKPETRSQRRRAAVGRDKGKLPAGNNGAAAADAPVFRCEAETAIALGGAMIRAWAVRRRAA